MDFNRLKKYLPAVLIGLVIIYAGLILYFILKYGVDVPYNDQWEYVSFFKHFKNGTLTFKELFNFQGEYRQLFPNLIFLGLGSITNWNVKFEMITIFIMACVIAYNIYRLAGYTLQVSGWQKWLIFFFAILFIFSPCQYENWLFGVQIEYFMPILCLTSCMVIMLSGIKPQFKLIVCILLSIISIYSSVNGLLGWFIILPLFFISNPNKDFFKKLWVIYIWIFFTLITIKFYFSGYKTPVHFPSPFLFLKHPGEAIQYFFGVLGNSFRIVHNLKTVIIVGGGLFFVFILQIIYIGWHYKDKQLVNNSFVWILLGLFSVATVALVTVGRLGFGLEQSLTPRYTTFSLYFIVAIIYLFAIIFQRSSNKVYKTIIGVVIALFLYNGVGKYRDSVTDLKAFHSHIQHGKAGLLLIEYIPHEECVNKIFPFEFKKLKKRARSLDSLGYLRPPLIKSNIVQDFEGDGSGTTDYGRFERLTQLNDSMYVAYGYSKEPLTHGPADAVLLSFDTKEGKSCLITLTNADSIKWKKTFSIAGIPGDSFKIRGWSFNANTGKAYKLKGDFLAIKKDQKKIAD